MENFQPIGNRQTTNYNYSKNRNISIVLTHTLTSVYTILFLSHNTQLNN